MRKHRKWWMGLGLGIMLGAMMLQLINAARQQPVLGTEQDKIYSQQELDQAVEQARKDMLLPASTERSEADIVSQEPPTATSPAEASGLPASDALPTGGDEPGVESSARTVSEAGKEPVQIVAFYVNKGMDLLTVARSLEALGVISDAEDFTEAARPISKKVEIGTAAFAGHPTYDEIIAELTRPKDD